MCIIVAKPSGAKMPSNTIISNCFANNPDGAGIMYNVGGKVHGIKGLMTLDAFEATLKKIEKQYGKLTMMNVVMHFRIGTHGSNIAANTHPFPVSSSYKRLRELEWESGLGMAHNGIIDATCYHGDIKKENVSDTMVFIKRIVHPISVITDIMGSKKILEAIQLSSGSKLTFLDGNGNLKVLGNFTFDDGVYYSNDSYKAIKLKTVTWPYYSGYGYGYALDEEFDDYGYGENGWGSKWSSYSYTTKKNHDDKKEKLVCLSKDDERYECKLQAEELGLILLSNTDAIIYKGGFEERIGDDIMAYDPVTGDIFWWDGPDCGWFDFLSKDSYSHIASRVDADD